MDSKMQQSVGDALWGATWSSLTPSLLRRKPRASDPTPTPTSDPTPAPASDSSPIPPPDVSPDPASQPEHRVSDPVTPPAGLPTNNTCPHNY